MTTTRIFWLVITLFCLFGTGCSAQQPQRIVVEEKVEELPVPPPMSLINSDGTPCRIEIGIAGYCLQSRNGTMFKRESIVAKYEGTGNQVNRFWNTLDGENWSRNVQYCTDRRAIRELDITPTKIYVVQTPAPAPASACSSCSMPRRCGRYCQPNRCCCTGAPGPCQCSH